MVEAEQGETLEDFAKRTDSVWTAKELGVVNSLPEDKALEAGRVVKIAVRTTYKAGT